MSTKRLYVTLFFIALAFSLLATQEPIFPKGCFDEFPQPWHHNSRLDSKAAVGARQVVWSENFESASSWQLVNNWEIGDPIIGPNGAAEGQHCLATGLDDLYANDANITATSPLITLPAASYVELNFSEWFELESSWDFAYVEVIQGTNTFTIDARTGTSGSMYRNTSLNLSRFQNSSVKLQFHLVSDGSVPAAGWYIDTLSITAVEPLPMNLQITAVNHSHYPSVYLSASVNSPQGLITDLNTTHFTALENGIPQQDLFTVISPGIDQISAADIVFVLDVTGSMGDEIESVRTNLNSFMNQLQGEGIDYRVGFVVFGDIVHVYNAYQFYTDYAQIMDVINGIQLGEHGIGSGGDGPENQVEAMAQAAQMQWRPGASRNMILLTDATSHESDYVTPWTMGDLLAEYLIPNSIMVFPIFRVNDPEQMDQYLPIAEQTNPQGAYYNIMDNFNAIITQIGEFITSLYTVHFRSMVPYENPITRLVTLEVQRDGFSSQDRVYYIPGISPQIKRSDALCTLDQGSVASGQAILFTVEINDRLAPYVTLAEMYWRRLGQTNYAAIPIVQQQGNIYQATLPASEVHGTAIEYYIQATDGQTTNTLPSSTPQYQPYCIPINPYTHAQFDDLNQAYVVGVMLCTSLECTAPTTPTVTMYYRPIGSLTYRSAQMTNSGGNNFSVTVMDDLGLLGAEFYFMAVQANGISSYYGTEDEPLSTDTYSPSAPGTSPGITQLRVYPNPMKSGELASFSFNSAEDQSVRLEIYNIKGQKVRSLGPLSMSKGTQFISWDGRDSDKERLGSGIYLYRLVSSKRTFSGKLLLK